MDKPRAIAMVKYTPFTEGKKRVETYRMCKSCVRHHMEKGLFLDEVMHGETIEMTPIQAYTGTMPTCEIVPCHSFDGMGHVQVAR